MMRKIIYVANTGHSLYHFRLPIMRYMQGKGWSVLAVADGSSDFQDKFAAERIRFVNVFIDRVGQNPINDLALVSELRSLYAAEKPDVVHHFSIKPVIFGSLAAKMAGVPAIVNTITGLGYSFKQGGYLRWLTIQLYRLALCGRSQVIFQNRDDYRFFVGNGIVKPANARVILGSGVDTEQILYNSAQMNGRGIRFLMVSRMLWSKGVREYVTAAEKVKAQYPNAFFTMAGGASWDCRKKNPEAVPDQWLRDTNSRGVVRCTGWVSLGEVMSLLDEADVFVAPSYYPEGVPRSLIEAAAKGKPIITTKTPGCREVVIDGLNGFLVAPRDPEALRDRFMEFIRNPGLIRQMGEQSRRRAVEIFDEKKVFAEMLHTYVAALGTPFQLGAQRTEEQQRWR